jgi:hypothetical protein
MPKGRQKPIVLVIDAGEMARRIVKVKDVPSHHGYDIVECRDDADALRLAHQIVLLLADALAPARSGGSCRRCTALKAR